MSANETQVGGTHYKTRYEHWDMAADAKLGYFEGQITKYVTRHRKKKGREDVEKALHLAVKLRERHRADDKTLPPIRDLSYPYLEYLRYITENDLQPLEYSVIRKTIRWLYAEDLDRIVAGIERMLKHYYPAPDAGEPGAGYVNQDRGAA